MKQNSQSIKCWGMKLRKKNSMKKVQKKHIEIKSIMTKFDIKMKWNQMLMVGIEKIIIKRMVQK